MSISYRVSRTTATRGRFVFQEKSQSGFSSLSVFPYLSAFLHRIVFVSEAALRLRLDINGVGLRTEGRRISQA